MPYIIRPWQARNCAVALISALLFIGASPAVAGAACPSNPISEVFAQLGDDAGYTLVPGGTFESGSAGWSLSDAEVTGETGIPGGGSSALVIQPRGQAVSPAFCVSSEYPTFRFLVREVSGGGLLNVGLRWNDVLGFHHETPVASLQGDPSWAISPVLQLASRLPLLMPGSTLTVRLTFSSAPGVFLEQAGTWAIDDVYIDPYSR
jgi:hypothetical protein